MKKTISENEFVQAFEDMNRGENFTLDGLRALFDYLENLEQDLGEEMELDVIALCCEFSEYDSAKEAAERYGWEPDEEEEEEEDALDAEEQEEDALNWLRDRTTIIEVDGSGVIITEF